MKDKKGSKSKEKNNKSNEDLSKKESNIERNLEDRKRNKDNLNMEKDNLKANKDLLRNKLATLYKEPMIKNNPDSVTSPEELIELQKIFMEANDKDLSLKEKKMNPDRDAEKRPDWEKKETEKEFFLENNNSFSKKENSFHDSKKDDNAFSPDDKDFLENPVSLDEFPLKDSQTKLKFESTHKEIAGSNTEIDNSKPEPTSDFIQADQPDPSTPPNIYDIFLRIYYHYQAEWIFLTQKGKFLGVLTKKYIMSRLSEIEVLEDPFLKEIKETKGSFPSISECLRVMQYQKSFPLVDRSGKIIANYSRGFALSLMEKANEEGGIIPLLMAGNEFLDNAQGNLNSNPVKVPEEKQSEENIDERADISKRIETETQNIDWFMSLILESHPFGLVAIDDRYRIIFYNERFKNLINKGDLIKNVEGFEAIIKEMMTKKEKKIKSLKRDSASLENVSELNIDNLSLHLTLAPLKTNRSIIGFIFVVKPLST